MWVSSSLFLYLGSNRLQIWSPHIMLILCNENSLQHEVVPMLVYLQVNILSDGRIRGWFVTDQRQTYKSHTKHLYKQIVSWSHYCKTKAQLKHANYMTMTTSGHIMSWPDYLKTKGNMNMKLSDLCETGCLYFVQYISVSQHGIDCKQTWRKKIYCMNSSSCFGGLSKSVKLHNAVTFQMLHCAITFDEKWQNWPTLVISCKVIRGIHIFLTRYYENLDFQDEKNCFKIRQKANIRPLKIIIFGYKKKGFWVGQIFYIMLHTCATQFITCYHVCLIFPKMLHMYVTWLSCYIDICNMVIMLHRHM